MYHVAQKKVGSRLDAAPVLGCMHLPALKSHYCYSACKAALQFSPSKSSFSAQLEKKDACDCCVFFPMNATLLSRPTTAFECLKRSIWRGFPKLRCDE